MCFFLIFLFKTHKPSIRDLSGAVIKTGFAVGFTSTWHLFLCMIHLPILHNGTQLHSDFGSFRIHAGSPGYCTYAGHRYISGNCAFYTLSFWFRLCLMFLTVCIICRIRPIYTLLTHAIRLLLFCLVCVMTLNGTAIVVIHLQTTT